MHTAASMVVRVCHCAIDMLEPGYMRAREGARKRMNPVKSTMAAMNFLLHMKVMAHDRARQPHTMHWSITQCHGGAPGADMSWKMPMVPNMKKMATAILMRALVFRPSQKSLRLNLAIGGGIIRRARPSVSVLLVGIPLLMRECPCVTDPRQQTWHLRDRRSARSGRDGRGVPCAGYAAGPRRRHQGVAAAVRAGPRPAGAVRT